MNSNHLIKVLAVYALADKPGVAGVAYVDIDAMASRADALPGREKAVYVCYVPRSSGMLSGLMRCGFLPTSS